MIKLSVNLNKVAWLRNARTLTIPSVIRAAQTCISAGAQGITVHPRPDQRHIRYHDVFEIAELLTQPQYQHIEFNIEGNPFDEFMSLVERAKPAQCTLVPDSPDQSTSDHGWNLRADGARLKPIIDQLHDWGVRTSIFLDPDPQQLAIAQQLGCDRIELYTEPYASEFAQTGAAKRSLPAYIDTARAAQQLGIGINAGHDLNCDNLPLFCQQLPGLQEVSIGHALIADSVFDGLEKTVQAYLAAITRSVTS